MYFGLTERRLQNQCKLTRVTFWLLPICCPFFDESAFKRSSDASGSHFKSTILQTDQLAVPPVYKIIGFEQNGN